LLKPPAEPVLALAAAVQVAARIGLAIRIGGKVDDPEIRAQPVVGRKRGRFGNRDDPRKIKDAVAINQIRLAAHATHSRPIVPIPDDGDQVPPGPGQQRPPVPPCARQEAGTVRDGSCGRNVD